MQPNNSIRWCVTREDYSGAVAEQQSSSTSAVCTLTLLQQTTRSSVTEQQDILLSVAAQQRSLPAAFLPALLPALLPAELLPHTDHAKTINLTLRHDMEAAGQKK